MTLLRGCLKHDHALILVITILFAVWFRYSTRPSAVKKIKLANHSAFALWVVKHQNFHSEIVIGNNVTVAAYCHIGCINKVTIEDEVLIAGKVFISDHFHGMIEAQSLSKPPVMRDLFSKGPVHIGKRVWIGEGVCIMPGVTIGENSIIGANSVVTKDIPANRVAAGVPARVIELLNADE